MRRNTKSWTSGEDELGVGYSSVPSRQFSHPLDENHGSGRPYSVRTRQPEITVRETRVREAQRCGED